MILRSQAEKKGPRSKGATRLRMSKKAGQKVMSDAGLMSGKVAGTMRAVAKLERRVKVVRFCIEPPILPAMIGAAVAVGMIKHMRMPCARTGLCENESVKR